MLSIDAMITWTPNKDPFLNNPTCGIVRVIHHHVEDDNDDIPCSVGACDAGWRDLSAGEREEKVNEYYRMMVDEDNIDPEIARRELNRIEDVRIR